MELLIGTSQFSKDRGDFPEFPVVNMFVENAPSENGLSLVSRFGLKQLGDPLGTGPIRGIFQREGILNGDIFCVSGSALYRNNVLLGTIDGEDVVSIAGYQDSLFVNAGKNIWYFNGTELTLLPFPDGSEVTRIGVAGSRLIALKKNSQIFYWSEILSPTIDGLSFASAENIPDFLYDLIVVGDTLVLFGKSSTEFWPLGEDPEAPFTPLRGRAFSVGIKNTGAATRFKSSFAWITNENQVCILEPANVVSYQGLEAELRKTDYARLWSFEINGDNCLAVQTETKTYVYHTRSQLWSEFTSENYPNWVAGCYENGTFGSLYDGRLIEWSETFDDFGAELTRTFRAWLSINTGSVVATDITLRTNPGQTPYLVGLFADPTVELRTSRNGGQTWGPYRKRRLGASGLYRAWTKWNSNGMFGYPGMLLEFRVSDPVPFRVSGVFLNEAKGGL